MKVIWPAGLRMDSVEGANKLSIRARWFVEAKGAMTHWRRAKGLSSSVSGLLVTTLSIHRLSSHDLISLSRATIHDLFGGCISLSGYVSWSQHFHYLLSGCSTSYSRL